MGGWNMQCPLYCSKRFHEAARPHLKSIIMNANNKVKTAGDCINMALYWLEGTVDGTCETREEVLAILGQAICALQAAYTRMLFCKED